MHIILKISLTHMDGDLQKYFNWTANMLMPVHPTAADDFLKVNKKVVVDMAQTLLQITGFSPVTIYRGIILKRDVDIVQPHERLQYLSFSADNKVAEHFADIKGFGSDIMNVERQLGKYGYVITYTPRVSEILFHYDFLTLLPYAEAFTMLGMDGPATVSSLQDQKEITILQPVHPLTLIKKMFTE